ncbi:hypothetical protein G9A89_006274 [Geosiphon pyriformis]|nr:hypothetical protein G9A89_006274 [Geosiphon pyriformis]
MSIAVIKKAAKVFGSSDGFRPVLPRKKRRSGILENGSGNHSWSLETGDTTESKSIDIKEECLIEETSFDYGEGGALAEGDYDQTPMGLKVKTKKTLDKPLEKIDFSPSSNDDDVLLVLPPSAKNLVNVSIQKSFALDIGLDTVIRKFSCEKLLVVRNLVSKINGFGGASTLSKFAGIIRAMFTSELSLMKATKLATDTKILVNTDLKKLSGYLNWTVVLKEIPVGTSTKAVCTALSSFGVVQKAVVEFSKSEQADLVAACWFIMIGKDAMHVVRADQNKES